jgi:hypothetical protein
MRIKRIVNLALGLFVIVAVALVARQAMSGRESAPPRPDSVPVATSVAASVAAQPPLSGEPEPEASAASAPVAAALPVAAASVSAERPPARVPLATPLTSVTPIERTPAAAPRHKVVAIYFHGDVRCFTCRKVEDYAKEAVEEGFGNQIATGEVEFRAVNVDRPENRHFIQDYQLTNKSVVVVDEVGSAVTRWVKLDQVWALVGNRDAYLVYVQDAVRAYVEN